jgi:hypothetical protein
MPQFTRSIEPRRDVIRRKRAKGAIVNIVLAGPHDFHRLLRRLGQEHGVDDEILGAISALAKAATQQQVIQTSPYRD